MATTVTEVFYLTRDNTADLILKADGVAVDLTDMTKLEVLDADCTWSVNSVSSPTSFGFDKPNGKVILKFGQEAIEAGTYTCQIVVYDPTNQEGIVWGEVKLVFRTSCGVQGD